MDTKILAALSELSVEEQSQNDAPTRSLYAKAGSFIIDRRLVSGHTAGEETAALCLRRHPRFRDFPTHTHDFIELMYVCQGSITHTVGDEQISLAQDDLILLGRYASHSVSTADYDDLCINLIVSPDLFEQFLLTLRKRLPRGGRVLEGLLRRDGTSYLVFHGSESLSVRNLVESMIDGALRGEADNDFLLEQSMGLLLGHLALLSKEDVPPKETAGDVLQRKLITYLHSSYSTATLTEAARMLGVAPAYLSRRTTEIFGVSFKMLLMNERFAAATELLRTTSLSVGEIHRRVGYETRPQFYKEFRRRYGMTPQEFRAQYVTKEGQKT